MFDGPAFAAVGSAQEWRQSQRQFGSLRGAGEDLPQTIRSHFMIKLVAEKELSSRSDDEAERRLVDNWQVIEKVVSAEGIEPSTY